MRKINLQLTHCSQHNGKTIQGINAMGALQGLLAWNLFLICIMLLLTHWRPHPFREEQFANVLIQPRSHPEKQQKS